MLKPLAVLSLLALEVSAFWRLPCRGTLTTERLDPLVQFGGIAEHVHSIFGANGFSRTCSATDLMKSTCSSCQVKEDNSAYWVPSLYFQDKAGNFKLVQNIGGMLVYYLPRGENVMAFPDGFRMIAGDANLRSFPWRIMEKSLWNGEDSSEAALRQKAIAYTCLNYDKPANSALAVYELPQDLLCKDGLRTEVFFPSCWNGELDSPDHRDHMRYPDLMDSGNCPKGYKKRLVSLFYETIWDVNEFYGQGGQFVWSTGDPTGYGYHADFMNGWQKDVLQDAIDKCTSSSGVIEDCKSFTLVSEDDMYKCKIAPTTDEDVSGPMPALPGCNPIEYGPEKATKPGCHKSSTGPPLPTKPSAATTPSTSTEKPTATFKAKQEDNNAPNPHNPATTSPPPVVPGYSGAQPDTYGNNNNYNDNEVVVVTVTRTEYVDPPETTVTLTGYRKRAMHAHHKARFAAGHHRH